MDWRKIVFRNFLAIMLIPDFHGSMNAMVSDFVEIVKTTQETNWKERSPRF